MKKEDLLIKCEALQMFTLSRFGELMNIQRRLYNQDGQLYKGDVFECSLDLAKYLEANKVVKIIEVKI